LDYFHIGTGKLHYSVEKFYEKIRLVKIGVKSSNLNGQIKAFVRKEPQLQLKTKELTKFIKVNEFKNQHALIIGGSRGLGEITAKILAAGGAKVSITYSKGLHDAKKVIEDISSCTPGNHDIKKCDILEGNFSPLVLNTYTHLYYFATPLIRRNKDVFLDRNLIDIYLKFYVENFSLFLQELVLNGINHVFYPSTVFINYLDKNFKEYSMVKLIGELYCKIMEHDNSDLIIYTPRLPKMKTDQTVSLFEDDGDDTFFNILNHIRIFNSENLKEKENENTYL
jgi:hypothetical protein